MGDWKRKSKSICGDVVYFEYIPALRSQTTDWVYVWDIDKTYLDTRIESVRGLFRAAFEKAFQKKNVPGTGALVRALCQEARPKPIYFLSASPPQLESKINSKWQLDGVRPFGAFFKDNLRNLRPRLWRKLRQQVGYKLQALLELRLMLGKDIHQILWGDDSESDAVIYTLYSDLCARRMDEDQARYVLSRLSTSSVQIEIILDHLQKIPPTDPVDKIYINLAADTDPDYYSRFGSRLVPTFNTFQIALDLFQDQRLTLEQILKIGEDMTTNYGYTPEQLSSALTEFIERGCFTKEKALEIELPLKAAGLLPNSFFGQPLIVRDRRLIDSTQGLAGGGIDYLSDI